MFDINFETEEERWQWGGILAGLGVGSVATITIAVCLCRNCFRRRMMNRELSRIYKERAKKTELCVDNGGGVLNPNMETASAPPYDSL